jgi:hypothetical protein
MFLLQLDVWADLRPFTQGKHFWKKHGFDRFFFIAEVRPFMRFLNTGEKPRYLAVFTWCINGLTTAVFITGENCGLDQVHQPHLDFSQSPGGLPFDGAWWERRSTSMYSHASFASSEVFSGKISDKIWCKQQRSVYLSSMYIRLDFIHRKTKCVRAFLWNRSFGWLNPGFRNR